MCTSAPMRPQHCETLTSHGGTACAFEEGQHPLAWEVNRGTQRELNGWEFRWGSSTEKLNTGVQWGEELEF